MNFNETARIVRLRERLRNATYHELEKDGHHKSSEGSVTLSFHMPPVVGGDEEIYWSVEVYSYLRCPEGRSKTWLGVSAIEAISKAEDDVKRWCMDSEMEQFSEFASGDVDKDEGHPVPW